MTTQSELAKQWAEKALMYRQTYESQLAAAKAEFEQTLKSIEQYLRRAEEAEIIAKCLVQT